MDKMYDVPKKKVKNLDPKFSVTVPLKGEAAMKEYRQQISTQGVAKANADAKKALEKKYPGMFIPETRTTPGVKKK